MKHRLIEKLTNQPDQVSDFETIEELQAHKALRQEASPESSFEDPIDMTAEHEAEKSKKEKKKLALEAFKNLENAKGTTVAQVRAEQNELRAILKEILL